MVWIDCEKEYLPEEGELVIIYSENKYGVTMGKYEIRKAEIGENKYHLHVSWSDIFGNSAGRVNFWMKLPGTPEEVSS